MKRRLPNIITMGNIPRVAFDDVVTRVVNSAITQTRRLTVITTVEVPGHIAIREVTPSDGHGGTAA